MAVIGKVKAIGTIEDGGAFAGELSIVTPSANPLKPRQALLQITDHRNGGFLQAGHIEIVALENSGKWISAMGPRVVAGRVGPDVER